ncbi:hypothetical protein BGZ97_004736 [Linnemannia gamsii]|uniref:Uncharacterized protein n=1 Tax=Linnemannia gamsii TaxID=64522 RepID=A0A9P6UGU3_9FUNG|nr:hypothetical protein BGZ97_004736 [Linnemannia gamsii]
MPSGDTMPGANGSGLPTLPYGIAAAGLSQQLMPGRGTMPGGPGSIYPGSPGAPPLPSRTPRAPRAPQFRGTVGAPQLYGEGVVDMSGEEYDAAPESYFARPTGPRAPQLGCQGGEDDTSSTTTAAQDGGGKQQEQPVKTSGAGILEKDDIQSYYQAPVFPDKKGQNPLQDVKLPIHEQQQDQQDPYYQSHQQSAPVVYRPPAAPQFSPQMDQHQQPPSISSVVNPVSSPAIGYAETPTVYSPPSTTPYPPPAVAASPALSHYTPP